MKISYLTASAPIYGAHSGYRLLPHVVGRTAAGVRIVDGTRNPLARTVDAVLHRPRAWMRSARYRRVLEGYFYWVASGRLRPGGAHHVISFETHHELLRRFARAPRNLLATLHHPSPWQLDAGTLADLDRAGTVITLSRHALPFLTERLGEDRVAFVHHGADTEFFRPAPVPHGPPRLLFAGRILRDEAMLVRVLPRLAGARPALRFDLLVTRAQRAGGLRALEDHPAVRWHHRVTDQQLRDLYRSATATLLPLADTSANNTVVESLAAGVPLVTTAVGGIRDYGGESLFPVVAAGDDDAMVELALSYVDDRALRDEVGARGRRFATETLAWPAVAERHLQLYHKVAAGDGPTSGDPA